VCMTPGMTYASFGKLTDEYKNAFVGGERRDQEEWYKRRTADLVFAALEAATDGLKLYGAADSAVSRANSNRGSTVPKVTETTHKRAFTVHDVQAFIKPDALESLRRDRQGSRKDFVEWTLSLSCVYAHGINYDVPTYDLRYVGDRRSSLEPIARATHGPAAYAEYNREDNASLAALLTVMLMIKALEFAHQCSLVGDELCNQISSPFAVGPGQSPLYNKLLSCAVSWLQEPRRRFRNINPIHVIMERLEGAARAFLTIPAAVFSGIRRELPPHVLEYIPTMTQEEFVFLMTIPGMCVRVNGHDYNGEKPSKKDGKSGPMGPRGPLLISSDSVLFYHLPSDRDKTEKLAKSIVDALNKLGIKELRISGSLWINAYGGVPGWGSTPFLAPFLAGYRQRMGAYKERKHERRKEKERMRHENKENKENKEKSEGCSIL
jgi:hypothetical protein